MSVLSDADREEFYHGAVYGNKSSYDTWAIWMASILWRGRR